MTAPVRFSHLKRMAQSPAHYKYYLDNPQEPTAAMRIGTCAHIQVLGASFKEHAIWRGGRRAGKEWTEFLIDNPDREIYTADEWDAGTRIHDAVWSNADAASLLNSAPIREWDHSFRIGSRECGVRPDAFGEAVLIELKACPDASPARFPHHAMKMGYHAQLAWQMDAFPEGTGWTPYIIAVESKPPHNVVVYEVTPASIDLGRRTYWLWWERLMACEAANVWPGYVQSIVPLEPPMEADDVALTIGDEEVTL